MKAIIATAIAFVALAVGTAQAAPNVELSATYYPEYQKIEWVVDGPRAGRDLAIRMTCEDDGVVTEVRMNRVYWNSAKNADWIALVGGFEWNTCEGVVFEVEDGAVPAVIVPLSNTVVVTP